MLKHLTLTLVLTFTTTLVATKASADMLSTEEQIAVAKQAVTDIIQPHGFSIVPNSVSLKPTLNQPLISTTAAIFNPLAKLELAIGLSAKTWSDLPFLERAFRVSGGMSDGRTQRRFATYLGLLEFACEQDCSKVRAVLESDPETKNLVRIARPHGIVVVYGLYTGAHAFSKPASFESMVRP